MLNLVYKSGDLFLTTTQAEPTPSWGRNVSVKLTGSADYDRYLLHHETGHLSQIDNMGATKFYSRTIKEYMKYGLGKVYGTSGTLEYAADYYAYNKLGYVAMYINGCYISYKFPFSFVNF